MIYQGKPDPEWMQEKALGILMDHQEQAAASRLILLKKKPNEPFTHDNVRPISVPPQSVKLLEAPIVDYLQYTLEKYANRLGVMVQISDSIY